MISTIVSHVAVITFGMLPFSLMHPAVKPVVLAPKPIVQHVQIVPQPTSVASVTPPPQPTAIPAPTPLPPPPPAPVTYPFSPMNTYTNSYDWGNCTYGVASMIEAIPSDWGNANQWPYMAEQEGYTVSATPVLGAVAEEDIGSEGHVAVVTGLNGDGTIQITEMNYDGTGDGLWRTRTADISEFQYIYI